MMFSRPTIILLFIALMACEPVENEFSMEISTEAVQHLEYLSHRFTGKIGGLGDEEISEHGFCWSESESPDISGSNIRLGTMSSSGEFSCIVSDFAESTGYFLRAYVVVNNIPYYGNELTFTTSWSAKNSVMDVDGNLYKTVRIGNQTWMAQNLKVTRYSDMHPIQNVKDHATWFDFSEQSKAYCYFDNELNNMYAYGALYTWAAASNGSEGSDLNPSGIQGVCPTGWHLPSDSEWKELEVHLGMNPEDADRREWRGAGVGGKMKREGSAYWKSPNSGANNESGFTALPGGYRHGSAEFLDLRHTARFWTSTMDNSYGWFRGLDYDHSSINRSSDGLYSGHSVRCVKDD